MAKEAVERARRGDGPTLIEAITYRNHGHFEGDEQKYKAPDGIEKEWADVDALEVFRDLVTERVSLAKMNWMRLLPNHKKMLKMQSTLLKRAQFQKKKLSTKTYLQTD